MDEFRTRLIDCIERRNTSQAEVARRAHVSAASVSDWARGVTSAEQVKAAPLLAAAKFLQVDPAWLLTGRGRRDSGGALLAQEQPSPAYVNHWPFESLDSALVCALRRDDLLRLEGAWLLAAAQLGLAVGKRRAA